jgi:hypothetical protein
VLFLTTHNSFRGKPQKPVRCLMAMMDAMMECAAGMSGNGKILLGVLQPHKRVGFILDELALCQTTLTCLIQWLAVLRARAVPPAAAASSRGRPGRSP